MQWHLFSFALFSLYPDSCSLPWHACLGRKWSELSDFDPFLRIVRGIMPERDGIAETAWHLGHPPFHHLCHQVRLRECMQDLGLNPAHLHFKTARLIERKYLFQFRILL